MTLTIASWWWIIPLMLTIVTWVYFYIKLEVSQDTGGIGGGIATLVWLLLSGFLTTIYYLIYFIIF